MKAVCFDTETTGLPANHVVRLDKQPHVIELYACQVDLDSGEVEGEVEFLIQPPSLDLVTDEIQKITGISREELADKPAFSVVAAEVLQFLSSRDAIAAHNLSFDMEMIDVEMERIGSKMQWPLRLICTVEATEFVKGYRLNLSALHEELFGLSHDGAHRAKADVQALVRCCWAMRKKGWL